MNAKVWIITESTHVFEIPNVDSLAEAEDIAADLLENDGEVGEITELEIVDIDSKETGEISN